ncbi:ATP-dependent (S)-NAD(P)H-hydrate dehydratase [Galendromus occidentalis]|uniref:ATP-dependent (S)-NAD(P)H-hydrate dehydratase n=1 Tax=Galendromus occidentalis TaxID=34638 RepID=A0AAJ6QM15_9ACAR|nr:ATP-dependent (S)-NAD(P)H-hydrate dehydratase [Galendromus occidentalis]
MLNPYRCLQLFSRRSPIGPAFVRQMASTGRSSIIGVNEYQRYVCSIVPPLDFNLHKGQCGRVAVVGGSDIYTGAPYYVGMSALRLGADLVYIVTTKEAAPVIKSYSPELMVLPYLNAPDSSKICEFLLPRAHALIIGPGLRLDAELDEIVSTIIKEAIRAKKPIIFDATVFPLLRRKLELFKGYSGAVLTPNIPEFKDLYEAVFQKKCESVTPDAVEELAAKLGNVTILSKGPTDIISDGKSLTVTDEQGSPRRCGGQGDVLAGLLGTFVSWATDTQVQRVFNKNCPHSPLIVAALGASMVTRRSARTAFKDMRRSTLTTDIIQEIRDSFTALFPVD